ncbi:MAG: glucosamine-6-phosphate deaminase [Bryobacteraceae bacterium]
MIRILPSKHELAVAAAGQAHDSLRRLLEKQNSVRLLAATGASQIEFLERLTRCRDIDWKRIELFHLDEYIGIGRDHPASFARYIKERIIDPTGIERFHLLNGAEMPGEVGADLAFVGIGENGHLAFNDPPADFDTEEAYLIVDLDQTCRQQQVNEGWFQSIEEVPKRAITISIPQLLKSKEIICVVPDRRKAKAVKMCLEGPLSPMAPASVLRVHPNTTMYLDADSAALLTSR